MRKLLTIAVVFLTTALLSGCELLDYSDPAPQAAAPQPPFHSDPLTYKVLMKYNINFTYTTRSPDEAPDIVLKEFQARLEQDNNNGYGYSLAEGVEPNLIAYLTLHSDDSNNKTMELKVWGLGQPNYIIYYSTNNSYQDPIKMIDDMADRLNGYVIGGWTTTY